MVYMNREDYTPYPVLTRRAAALSAIPNLCSDLPRNLESRFESKRGAADEERRRAVVRTMAKTWGDTEIEAAHSSRESRRLRAEAVAGYFVRERFPRLLLVFEFSASCSAV